MKSILGYTSLILLGIVVLSVFRMAAFLKSRGKLKSAICSFNPLVFLDYITVTKKETGVCGIWFKIFVISLILGILFDVMYTMFVFVLN